MVVPDAELAAALEMLISENATTTTRLGHTAPIDPPEIGVQLVPQDAVEVSVSNVMVCGEGGDGTGATQGRGPI